MFVGAQSASMSCAAISHVARTMHIVFKKITNTARDEEERDAVKWQEEVDAVKAFREQVTSREEKQATAFNAGADSQGECWY